ncbi:site-specific integrase [Aminipila butyrica]|uniref:Site-specific integrase n=1 Tax=Aminipila butyrica TaxID=433296 RepID=A0A858BS41_9FIRM|nr:site-specific integrase [Aminipila butyrica]QIB67868.1 site-specific integrase [Aminipila butyrica]
MARRGENIYKRKDGRWEARYIKSRTLEGKAVYGYIYTRSYQSAKRAQAEARSNSSNHIDSSQSLDHGTSLKKYLNTWSLSIKMSVKKSTFSNYKGLIQRHIIPSIGDVSLYQVNNELVQQYVNEKLEGGRLDGNGGLSVKTTRDIVALLKRSLKPVGIEIKVQLPKYTLPKLRVLTLDEQAALIKAAMAQEDCEKAGILLSLFTGIRLGELCSLKWHDISFEEGILRIDKTIQRIVNYDVEESKTAIDIDVPKSEQSMRNIPLPQFLIDMLRRIRKDASEGDYILSGNQHFVEPRLCQYRFKTLTKSAGIERVNFHVLRHTFATRCVELGVDVKTISQLLGHSNVNITLNRYVHPTFEHQRKCLEKLFTPL